METSSDMSTLFPTTAGYADLRDALLRTIDDMLSMEQLRGFHCEELREKVMTNTFNLVVLGQFKRGKTTLINALLGAEILPMAVVPLTSVATIIAYGDDLEITVYFNDGRIADIDLGSLFQYVTEKGNPRNQKDVREVVITYPSPYLKDGVRIIDTPGVGSVYEHNTDVAYQYLPKSDAALFLLSVDQPLGKAEMEFLRDVREYSRRIFFLLNKADYFSESELRESMEFSTGVLKEALETDIRIFPVSARLALEGETSGKPEIVEKSRLPQFSAVLNRFLMEDKGKVLILSVTNNLLRLLSQARFELELEMRSLLTPLQELKDKIAVFEKKKKDVMIEKDDFYLLLDGEVKKIVNNVLEDDLNVIRRDLFHKASENLEAAYNGKAGASLKDLSDALEAQIVSDVKQAFAAWRVIEDERLATTFEASCARFVTRIDEIVDSLLKFSSELFAVPLDIVKADVVWSTKSTFYYKFKEQPGGIEIVASSLSLMLPKFIGEKMLLNKMKEYLRRVIDLQAARAGNDFERRLEKSKLDFRWKMLQRIEQTIKGIEEALQRGMQQKDKGEHEVEQRKEAIAAISEKLDGIKTALVSIRDSAERIKGL